MISDSLKNKLVALVLNFIFDLIQVKMQSKEITGNPSAF